MKKNNGSSALITLIFFSLFTWAIVVLQFFISERNHSLRQIKTLQINLHEFHQHSKKGQQNWEIPFSSGTIGIEPGGKATSIPVKHKVLIDFGR